MNLFGSHIIQNEIIESKKIIKYSKIVINLFSSSILIVKMQKHLEWLDNRSY